MAATTIRIFSANNLLNGSGEQPFTPGSTNESTRGGSFTVGSDTGTMITINDVNNDGSFDDGTGEQQFTPEPLTLTYEDAGGTVVTTTFPANSQLQSEFITTFSSGLQIVAIRLNPPGNGASDLITVGYAVYDPNGNPVNPPPGTNIGSIIDNERTGTVDYDDISCFTSGTLIETPKGMVQIDHLKPGDQVLTRHNGIQDIVWIGESWISQLDMVCFPALKPISIPYDFVGGQRDLLVSPQHRIMLRTPIAELLFGEPDILVSAKYLSKWLPAGKPINSGIKYLHIACKNHEIVNADGIWAETLYCDETTSDLTNAMQADLNSETLSNDPRTAGCRILRRFEADVLMQKLTEQKAKQAA
ncbi:Hint domain-containing protein [Parasulfitobacter algicola]|uniref:Hint domain-containing protein n=1 Tax=Parasulfitobacter algicola TaxID=2614809 RepID=A0ABX2IVI5_9RHOB|nr:Hint domain-containing protein [Sulfitobacter algicola]NSX54208.1 Hint domain-containing protein [Sulfitobacter algicola]